MTRARFIALGGFLGAGKTTTMIRAAQELQSAGDVVAIVTNDQGDDLVDTATSRAGVSAGVAAVDEVTGGCFCCRFDDLAAVVDGLLESHRPTVVLAEAVGSCTDLRSTVLRPLTALRGEDLDVAPLVVIADPGRYRLLRNSFGASGDDETDLAHLYHHQLAEADVIALNKIDTLAAADRRAVLDDLARRFPGTPVIAYSAATGDGVPELLDVWNSRSASPREDRLTPFAVDYDRYGAAEAALAWTNQVFELSGSFVADDWLDTFLDDIARRIADRDAFVGHIKCGWRPRGAARRAASSRPPIPPATSRTRPSATVPPRW